MQRDRFEPVAIAFLDEKEFIIEGGGLYFEAFDVELQLLVVQVNGGDDPFGIEFPDLQQLIRVEPMRQFSVGDLIAAVGVNGKDTLVTVETAQVFALSFGIQPADRMGYFVTWLPRLLRFLISCSSK